MLMTLGGSPEPIRKSIEKYRPGQIIFFASHDSVFLSSEIFKDLDFKPNVKYEITENPNLMFECYKKARSCMDRLRKANVSPQEVMVDYTGGTKVMTAALILAAAGNSYRFNYVGGSIRNKNGVGTVMDGHEELFAEMSPWSIFAEEERRQVVTLFNNRRFSAAIEISDNACEKELPVQIKSYFGFIRPLAMGFLKWDQFEHKNGLKHLNKGVEKLSEYLLAYPESNLDNFSDQAKQCIAFLIKVLFHTEGLRKFHRILIDDLLNNARRKIANKRFDDAAARIYRALELYGQILFENVAGCTNDKVDPAVIPDELRAKFEKKYKSPHSRNLKLPLTATFQYLEVMGQEPGKRFFQRKKEIKNIQSNRNASILAHGINPVTENGVKSIFKTISEFVEADCIFDFPKLP